MERAWGGEAARVVRGSGEEEAWVGRLWCGWGIELWGWASSHLQDGLVSVPLASGENPSTHPQVLDVWLRVGHILDLHSNGTVAMASEEQEE